MRDTYKQYTVNGKRVYAHNADEAAKKYREIYPLGTGDLLHINRRWYKVIGDSIFQIFKKK